jgi:hypothetical protein
VWRPNFDLRHIKCKINLKTDWWGNSGISSYFGRINQSEPIFIKFGEMIRVNDNGREVHQQVIRFIENCPLEWK